MLSEHEIQQYKTILLARQKDVNQQIEAIASWCEPVAPDQALGRLTRTDAMQDQQMALYQRQQLLRQQTRLKTALKRIDVGTYGICPNCKQDMDTRRLDVAPEAPLCVSCQGK